MEKGNYTGKFIWSDLFGFKTGHEYNICIDEDGHCYSITELDDLTDESDKNGYMTCSSDASIKRYWEIYSE